ncbi:uncharacterized protein Tco025E_08397 [Trypanosoma conorhini]|uniref:Uncharacterized protein n=1 Tax=Trypanosoma conorhini TaxID=83891 RepID=A0A3R7MAP0_9TRYP|nr:uncharacterized protein Tco025E_08397 [Trypanosoma conorhini]RNF02446.1 hypothetical protein Tco025E_08397 [Trypanosoma conorhini]
MTFSASWLSSLQKEPELAVSFGIASTIASATAESSTPPSTCRESVSSSVLITAYMASPWFTSFSNNGAYSQRDIKCRFAFIALTSANNSSRLSTDSFLPVSRLDTITRCLRISNEGIRLAAATASTLRSCSSREEEEEAAQNFLNPIIHNVDTPLK